MSPRARGGWLRNSWKVSCAAPRAASASSAVASGTSASVSPVAGSSTGDVPPSPGAFPPFAGVLPLAADVQLGLDAVEDGLLRGCRGHGSRLPTDPRAPRTAGWSAD